MAYPENEGPPEPSRKEQRQQRREDRREHKAYMRERRRERREQKRAYRRQRAEGPFRGGGQKKNLERIRDAAGIGMMMSPQQYLAMGGDPRMAQLVEQQYIPKTFNRGFGESLFRRGTQRMYEGQQAADQDLQAQLASQYGLGSGIAAEMQRRQNLEQAQQVAEYQTELERRFREAKIQELIQRLQMANQMMGQNVQFQQMGQQPNSALQWAGAGADLLKGIGSFFG